jgi:hypothetical protein
MHKRPGKGDECTDRVGSFERLLSAGLDSRTTGDSTRHGVYRGRHSVGVPGTARDRGHAYSAGHPRQ